MIKVKDHNGNEIPGMYKDSLGNIVVKNDDEYRRYVKEKKLVETINNLVKEVSELKKTVSQLLEIIHSKRI